MELRTEFINAWLQDDAPPTTVLAATFGISEKTAHKWLTRFREGGVAGLGDRSRRPHRSPAMTPQRVRDALIAMRRVHPTWGPKKLVARLARDRPELEVPAPSTAGEILRRAGLVEPRRRQTPRIGRAPAHLSIPTAPNDVWCVDFKGEFTVERSTCYPLTLTDAFSRYLLVCAAFRSTAGSGVRERLEVAFREFGLPSCIRSDNGSPFGSTKSIGGLSRLSIYLVRLGIRVEHIDPGKPTQNGQHERMHRTLKQEAVLPPSASWREQQSAFDAFRREFNDERPHEALAMRPPSEVYRPSPELLPARLPEPEYPTSTQVRRIRPDGLMKWNGRLVFVGEVLSGESVGLTESMDDGWWNVTFGPVHLGLVHADGRLLKRKRAVWSPPTGSPMSPV